MSPATATGIPAVSVVLPAYNRENSIEAAIRSVLNQGFRDLELIVVDDCSTDGTLAAVRAVEDPRLRVIECGTNAGAGAARNRGIAEARAPWVAFHDSDDLWLPAKLERQMARISAADPEPVAVYCGLQIERDDGSTGYIPGPEVVPREGDIYEILLTRSFISTQTLMVRRDLLIATGGFDPQIPALIDWDCVLRLAPLGQILCVDEPLVIQRFSANSITRSAEKRLRARLRILENHRDALAARPRVLARHHYAISGAWRSQGDWAEARRHLRLAIRLDPANPRYRAMALWLALSGGRVR